MSKEDKILFEACILARALLPALYKQEAMDSLVIIKIAELTKEDEKKRENARLYYEEVLSRRKKSLFLLEALRRRFQ